MDGLKKEKKKDQACSLRIPVPLKALQHDISLSCSTNKLQKLPSLQLDGNCSFTPTSLN